jgi:hypothetical protein
MVSSILATVFVATVFLTTWIQNAFVFGPFGPHKTLLAIDGLHIPVQETVFTKNVSDTLMPLPLLSIETIRTSQVIPYPLFGTAFGDTANRSVVPPCSVSACVPSIIDIDRYIERLLTPPPRVSSPLYTGSVALGKLAPRFVLPGTYGRGSSPVSSNSASVSEALGDPAPGGVLRPKTKCHVIDHHIADLFAESLDVTSADLTFPGGPTLDDLLELAAPVEPPEPETKVLEDLRFLVITILFISIGIHNLDHPHHPTGISLLQTFVTKLICLDTRTLLRGIFSIELSLISWLGLPIVVLLLVNFFIEIGLLILTSAAPRTSIRQLVQFINTIVRLEGVPQEFLVDRLMSVIRIPCLGRLFMQIKSLL